MNKDDMELKQRLAADFSTILVNAPDVCERLATKAMQLINHYRPKPRDPAPRVHMIVPGRRLAYCSRHVDSVQRSTTKAEETTCTQCLGWVQRQADGASHGV